MTEEAVQAAPSFPTDMNALHTVANCPTWTCRWLVAHLPSPGLELSPVMNAHSQESAERKAGSGSAPSHTPKPSRRSYPLLPKLSTYTPRCHEIIKSTPLPPSKKRNLKPIQIIHVVDEARVTQLSEGDGKGRKMCSCILVVMYQSFPNRKFLWWLGSVALSGWCVYFRSDKLGRGLPYAWSWFRNMV